MSYKSRKLKKINTNSMPGAIRALGTLKYRVILEGIAVGLLVGVVVSAFRFTLSELDGIRNVIVGLSEPEEDSLLQGLSDAGPGFGWIGLLILGVFAFAVSYFVYKEPYISGSGIPQVKGELMGRIKTDWLRVLALKFFGGIMAISSGLALGREGPSIQLGAMVGKGFSRLSGRLKTEERLLISAGAGAGLAAAFGAPLAGVVFVLEELRKDFDPKVLLSTMAAAVTSEYVASFVFGLQPVFAIFAFKKPTLNDYWMILILGALLGVLGVAYNRALALSQDLQAKIRPRWLKAVLAAFSVIVMAKFYPVCLGSGHSLVEETGYGFIAAGSLALILIVRFIYSIYSFATGAPGGIFLPLLVLGALAGGLFTSVLSPALGLPNDNIAFYVILGMAGLFSSIVRAPLTGIILISEMTGALSNLLPLSMVALVSYVTAEALGGEPVYDQLLERILRNK
ncbi:MAG: ClC family H(+)/Cl(-) exchange transporter [Firmicutes bacterium]|nr:ClC family H(+)/Cl(-) exchange transporter [Bacillota bacterium]